jgi:hypothetical protein
MQRITSRICGQESPPIGSIKDKMTCRLTDDSSADVKEISFERDVFGKLQMAWGLKSRNDGIEHLSNSLTSSLLIVEPQVGHLPINDSLTKCDSV